MQIKVDISRGLRGDDKQKERYFLSLTAMGLSAQPKLAIPSSLAFVREGSILALIGGLVFRMSFNK